MWNQKERPSPPAVDGIFDNDDQAIKWSGHHYQKFDFYQQQKALATPFDFTSFFLETEICIRTLYQVCNIIFIKNQKDYTEETRGVPPNLQETSACKQMGQTNRNIIIAINHLYYSLLGWTTKPLKTGQLQLCVRLIIIKYLYGCQIKLINVLRLPVAMCDNTKLMYNNFLVIRQPKLKKPQVTNTTLQLHYTKMSILLLICFDWYVCSCHIWLFFVVHVFVKAVVLLLSHIMKFICYTNLCLYLMHINKFNCRCGVFVGVANTWNSTQL